MAGSFELDIGKLTRAMKQSPEAVGRGAMSAMDEIKDDWVREARDIAPIDPVGGGNLRRQLDGDVEGKGVNSFVEVRANATQNTGGRRFNYGYYIHEGHMRADGKRLRTPGTVEEFLDESAEKRMKDYEKWMKEDIQAELRKEGW